jgi:hypothetical protein
MKNKSFIGFYVFSIIGVLLASIYPLYMGIRVVSDMISDGSVLSKNYPKYIIPYTPICLAILVGVLLMPLTIKYAKRFSLLAASMVSIGVFFASELLLEKKVIVASAIETKLENWQMFMCAVVPSASIDRPWPEINVLLGEYSPAFKIHFYVISLVLILSFLNCFYGFAQMIISKNTQRLKSLIIQAISSLIFLGLCILACFTAFFRTGNLQVSAVSAILMSAFFVVFGVTTGIFTGSFLLGKKRLSVLIPAAVSIVTTLIMYLGEMILLSGHLYRFGEGFLFDGLGDFVFAVVDLVVIVASGVICAMIQMAITKEKA